MFFSQTVPSVRYAAIALALVHRNCLDRDSSDRVHQPQSLKDWLPDEAPLLYYNRAIQLLLNQESGDSTEITAVTLLVCYLFISFDHLAGNYVQARKHLRGGVELSHNVDNAIMNNNRTFDDAKALGFRHLRQFRITFSGSWKRGRVFSKTCCNNAAPLRQTLKFTRSYHCCVYNILSHGVFSVVTDLAGKWSMMTSCPSSSNAWPWLAI